MRAFIAVAAIYFAFCASASAVGGVDPSQFETGVRQILANQKLWGAAVAVTYKDQLVYANGFGFLDETKTSAVDADTLFHVASGTKMFTALAIHKMAQDGLLNLDTPIYQYLPWFSLQGDPAAWKQITVRHLLNQNSGISREIGCLFTDAHGHWLPLTQSDLQACVQGQEVVYPPGSRLKYSNLGYILLGQIIAARAPNRSTGSVTEDYIQFVKNTVMQPFAMSNSRFVLQDVDLPLLANPYGYVDSRANTRVKLDKVETTYVSAPGWGLMTSAKEISNMLVFIYQAMNGLANPILEPDYASTIFANPVFDYFSTGGHNLGFMIFKDAATGHFRVGHNGNFPGYDCLITVDQQTGLGVAVLDNSVESGVTTAIANLAYQEFSSLLPAGILRAPYAPAVGAVGAGVAAATLDSGFDPSAWVGSYAGWPRTIAIAVTGGNLTMTINGGVQPLTPIDASPGEYRQSGNAGYTGHIGEKLKLMPADPTGLHGGGPWILFSKSYDYIGTP